MLDAEKIAEQRGLIRDLTTVLEKRNAVIDSAIRILSNDKLPLESRVNDARSVLVR